MATIENTDALNSPLYNPGYDSTDLALYNIMVNDSTDETNNALLKQYTNTFYNLSTTNPYEGLIQNPNKCDISDIGTSANNIVNSLQDHFGNQDAFDPNNPPAETDPNYENYTYWNQYVNQQNPDSVISYMTGGVPTTTTYSQDDVLNIPSDAIVSVGPDGRYQAVTYSQPSSIIPQTNYAQKHTDSLISNLPMLLSIAQTALGMATALEKLINPCLGLSDFFGSISDLGKEIMQGIKDAVSYVEGLINQGLQFLKDGIKIVMEGIKIAVDFILKLVSMIQKEIQKFINSLISAIKMGITSFLKGLLGDACAKSLLGSISTPALRYTL